MTEARICRICGQACPRWFSRRLCQRCYYRVPFDERTNYPTRIEQWGDTDYVLDCRCVTPLPEPIPVFQTAQCRRCGKRLELSPIEGNVS